MGQPDPQSAAVQQHPAVLDVLRFFDSGHLAPNLQEVAKPFEELAQDMAGKLQGAELTVGLRKLLEAKDCMVRAKLTS